MNEPRNASSATGSDPVQDAEIGADTACLSCPTRDWLLYPRVHKTYMDPIQGQKNPDTFWRYDIYIIRIDTGRAYLFMWKKRMWSTNHMKQMQKQTTKYAIFNGPPIIILSDKTETVPATLPEKTPVPNAWRSIQTVPKTPPLPSTKSKRWSVYRSTTSPLTSGVFSCLITTDLHICHP